MSDFQHGDVFGIFYNYGPHSCVYLGLAEYIGEKDVPKELVTAGEFNGKHIHMTRNQQSEPGSEKQMAFRLIESEEIVYEQEAWFTKKEKISKLLSACDNIIGSDISDVRESFFKERKDRENLPLSADGFLEIYATVKDFLIPPNINEKEVGEYLDKKITEALVCIGFSSGQFEIKIRSLNTKGCHKPGDAL